MNFSVTIWERCISAWHWQSNYFSKSGECVHDFFLRLEQGFDRVQWCKTSSQIWHRREVKREQTVAHLGIWNMQEKRLELAEDLVNTIMFVTIWRKYWVKHKNLFSSGRIFRFLVLHYLIAFVYSSRYLADMCWPFCHNPGSSILLYVLGFCSKSSGQSWRKTSMAEGPCVPRVRKDLLCIYYYSGYFIF